MILTLRKKTNALLLLVAASTLTAWCVPFTASAQDALALSVTPALFEMSAEPGQVWRSSVRVVNTNPYSLTVYLEAVNFAPQGEGGTGKFLPVFEEFTEGKTLAEWITLPATEMTIPPEKTEAVNFTVAVPEDASPGGHFAAILVGTKPPLGDDGRFQVRTTSVVTSLFFVRVAGDVVENGSIREFRVADRFVSEPSIDFELRFENKGNVHLQPQGEITIYNMWGKERGIIPINHQTHFGNVLPDSIRQFRFTWTGEWSFSEIGRYSAVVTLGFGEDGRQHVSSKTYFWVIPLKEVSVALIVIISVILLLTWGIKLYVRRMLIMAGVDPAATPRTGSGPRVYDPSAVKVSRYHTMAAPVRAGVGDLKERVADATRFAELVRGLWSFVVAYKIFFTVALVSSVALAGVVWYVLDARTDNRSYEVVIENPGSDVTLSSEELLYRQLASEQRSNGEPFTPEVAASSTPIAVVNRSGIPGVGATGRLQLENHGYQVSSLDADLSTTAERTVVVYNPALADEALAISQLFDGALLSARTEVDEAKPIVVFFGKDSAVDDKN